MPDQKMASSSAFIWYHADAEQQGPILQWQAELSETLGVQGRLLLRHDSGKTTFMEIYEHVESPLVEQIEAQAKQLPIFAGIERRCESFIEVNPEVNPDA